MNAMRIHHLFKVEIINNNMHLRVSGVVPSPSTKHFSCSLTLVLLYNESPGRPS